MSIFSKVINKIRNMTPKQVAIAGVFTLALAGAVGLGLGSNQFGSAASVRDSGHNPIFNANTNGGVGCLTAKECVADLRDNKPGDIQTIVKHFGLSPSEYSRFEKTARKGKTFRNGDVIVDGQKVITGANSMGRDKFNSQRKSIKIGGKTYYYSRTQDSFASGTNSIDTLVMFNSKGEVETAIMNACGNPVWGKKTKVTAECKSLSKKEVGLNKYEFTTNVSHSSLASVEKVVYYADGKKFAESKSKSSKYKVTETFDKSVTVTSKVYFKVPGKQTRIVSSTKCQTKITVKVPFYECKELVASVRNKDEDNTTYRFVAVSRQGNGAVLKNADFIVNGTTVATGVTSKTDGNIFRDITLEGGKTYTVEAKVHFTVNGKTVTAKEICKTVVKPVKEKKPFYACDLLRATAVDEELRKFRFTVIASYGDGATLKDADFTAWAVSNPDDKTTVSGVTQKDNAGNIYQEFEFEADGNERIVEATVNFNVKDGVQSVKCQAKVTPEEKPVCPIPDKEHLPPDSPECKEDEQPKEVLGKETELPKTGAASVAGIFFSATGAGAAAHRLIMRRLQK